MNYRKKDSDKFFNSINFLIVTFVFIVVLYPLIYVVSASFSSANAIVQRKVWLFPVEFNIEGYKAVFRHRGITSGYLNSLFYMITGTIVNVAMTIMAAYPLSRKDFMDRGLCMKLFVFTMYFSGGLIPSYLNIKNLGLVDSRWVLIIPGAISVYNVIITRTYFESNIPYELLEASQMDGCSDFKFLKSVVIPLSGPILAVITLFYAVGHWNTYFSAMIYLQTPSKFPLQIILRDILIQNEVSDEMLDVGELVAQQQLRELLKYSLIIVASLPLLVMYPFIQKFFVKGIMLGSVKG